ncbi:hypothetical protein CH330_00170 [candidate division WOR-3 bacterium JGI_Cruoil_03_51_56]|uniref:Uncharacterized protein n=1 Tax=candidate division WOR-3 bacterium JGI_Cruoil_03_51_56 TaxID=1973747 RepID=A0A235BZ35_UNCW3|nr:MAG: hypothetical protein CH330_00170 [candidate division WOR-3 bacterium JGI_Cruoil_03_51_56]
MRKVTTAFSVVALLFLFAGFSGCKKTSELQAQIDQQQQKITQLEGQVQTLTVARDSLQNLVQELSAPKGAPAKKPVTPKPKPHKPPKTGR